MGLRTTFKRFFDLDEEDYQENDFQAKSTSFDNSDTDNEIERIKKRKKQNIVSLQSVQQSAKVVLVEPRMFAEVQEIAGHLKNHKSVVINLQRVPNDQAKRIVDFLSGAIYTIDGDIQKLGPHTFLCAPENVDISGVITEIFENETQD